MSGKADLCKIQTSELGLEISVQQDVDTVDVVVSDGVVVFVVKVVDPSGNADGGGLPRRPVQNPLLCSLLGEIRVVQPQVEAAILLVVVDKHNEVAPPKAIFKTDVVVVTNAAQQVYLGLVAVGETAILHFRSCSAASS